MTMLETEEGKIYGGSLRNKIEEVNFKPASKRRSWPARRAAMTNVIMSEGIL